MRNWFDLKAVGRRAVCASLLLCAMSPPVAAQSALPTKPVWVSVPRVNGHLSPADMGLVININDPYSLAVGEHYARQRGIPAEQVLRLAMPVKASLNVAEFEALSL